AGLLQRLLILVRRRLRHLAVQLALLLGQLLQRLLLRLLAFLARLLRRLVARLLRRLGQFALLLRQVLRRLLRRRLVRPGFHVRAFFVGGFRAAQRLLQPFQLADCSLLRLRRLLRLRVPQVRPRLVPCVLRLLPVRLLIRRVQLAQRFRQLGLLLGRVLKLLLQLLPALRVPRLGLRRLPCLLGELLLLLAETGDFLQRLLAALRVIRQLGGQPVEVLLRLIHPRHPAPRVVAVERFRRLPRLLRGPLLLLRHRLVPRRHGQALRRLMDRLLFLRQRLEAFGQRPLRVALRRLLLHALPQVRLHARQ